MKCYLVGGAVRDTLLGKTPTERDWVVIGETPESMRALGYQQVGKDFPVFLHPETKEEYALARREYNVGPGHTGFKFDTSADISLEDDLVRRDLTVNAIAQASDGSLIDPCGGQADLKKRVFRHVSDAFTEDPLRILRLAQFQARFEADGFRIDPQTLTLCRKMVAEGALVTLSKERIFKELEKALGAPRPHAFFEVLEAIDAHKVLFQGLDPLGAHRLAPLYPEALPQEQFARLMLESPNADISILQTQMALPKTWIELSEVTIELSAEICRLPALTPEQILKVLHHADARRKPIRFYTAVKIATAWGLPSEEDQRPITQNWHRLAEQTAKITVNPAGTNLTGIEIRAAIEAEQLRVISDFDHSN